MPNWMIAALPVFAFAVVLFIVILCMCAVAFPKDKDGPRGGGMIE